MCIKKIEENEMNKKKRSIYEIELSNIVSWDNGDDFPQDMDIIDSIDGEDVSLVTANIAEACRFYRKHTENLWDDCFCELFAREIEVTDKEWNELLKKDRLQYDDYGRYLTEPNRRSIAWEYSYHGTSDRDDSRVKELLIVQSEYFNMRVVCERASISYSTYRGFKNNKKPMSYEKELELLKSMSMIGGECWDKELEETYQFYKDGGSKRLKQKRVLLEKRRLENKSE